MGFPGRSPEVDFVESYEGELERMEAVLLGREWLVADRFTGADLLMAHVLRQVHKFDGLADYPACHSYVARIMARPTFEKAYNDQVAHFAAADPV